MIVYMTRDANYPDYVEEEVSSYRKLFEFRDCRYFSLQKGFWNSNWTKDGGIFFPSYNLSLIGDRLTIISHSLFLRIGLEFSLGSCLSVYFLWGTRDLKRYCLKELIMSHRMILKFLFHDPLLGIHPDSEEYGMAIEYMKKNDL